MSKILSCDICKKQIQEDISYYIFKKRNMFLYKKYDYADDAYIPRRIDVCKECFNRFIAFVIEETEEE